MKFFISYYLSVRISFIELTINNTILTFPFQFSFILISDSGIFLCLTQQASYMVFTVSFIYILMKPVIQLTVIKSIILDFSVKIMKISL